MAFRSSSNVPAASPVSTADIPVPSGAAIGDIAVCVIYIEVGDAITMPSGFTNKIDLATNPTTQGRLFVAWKRLTAADSGTYLFSWTTGTYREGHCALFSDRIGTGDPFDGTVGTAESGGSVTTLNVSTSPAKADGDAVGSWSNFNGTGSFTAPTNYTERQDTGALTTDTRDTVGAGSTGSTTATYTVSDFMKAFLGVLAAPGDDSNPTIWNPLSQFPILGRAFQYRRPWQPAIPMQVWGWMDEAAGNVQTISAAGIDTNEASGASTFTPGAVTISPLAVPSDEISGAIVTGLTVSPTAIDSLEDLGSALIGQAIQAASVASSEVAGIISATTAAFINPLAVPPGEILGSILTTLTVAPASIRPVEILGSPTLTFVTLINPTGIASAGIFGAKSLTTLATVSPSSILTTEVFGAAAPVPGIVTLSPNSISTVETHGAVFVSPTMLVTPAGIQSLANVGTGTLTTAVTLSPASMASAERLGVALATPGPISLTISSIRPPEGVGFAIFGVLVSPAGIQTVELIGSVELTEIALTRGIIVWRDVTVSGLFGRESVQATIANREPTSATMQGREP